MNQTNTSHATSLTPILATERIHSLDVLRGIVLCGILLMNITAFGLYGSYADPTVSGGDTGYNLFSWYANNMLFEGTMRALFSLLFGVGMFILLERLEKKGAGISGADVYFRRLIWLLVFGLIHGYLLLWTGEILYDYALMGFLVYSFRNLSPKVLVGTAIVLVLIGSTWSFFEYQSKVTFTEMASLAKEYQEQGKELTWEQQDALHEWEIIQREKSPEFVEDFNSKMHGGYFSLVAHLAPFNFKSDTYYFYRYNLWDVLSMMLIGIAFFKWKLLAGEKPYRFYLFMVAAGYLIGLSINYYESELIMNNNFSPLAFSKANITYDFGRIAVAIGHIGMIMIFCKSPYFGWVKKALGALGKMALTNYIMHSIICMFVFTGVGFALFGKLQRYELLYVVFSIWIFQLIVSPIWLRYFHFGPLEWLWRNLSYNKSHAFMKK
ncbi:MAG TPA: DUF418 domain-containing protein [Saprospiraceae bacterium]|nr:DUF418 domain-containing protein [Saprospiraceae bacterium]